MPQHQHQHQDQDQQQQRQPGSRPGDAFATPRTATAGLYFAGADKVLLVNPTYKDGWELPGGYLMPGETPTGALRRELVEELGAPLPVGRLLVVDWAPNAREGDKVLWIFDGGELSDREHAAISVDGAEISEYAYHHRGGLDELLIPRLARRVHAAIDARANDDTYYLEHGARVAGS
jgi:8-oxo-dGTP pyrophosphatase MutT (NUDIX family)